MVVTTNEENENLNSILIETINQFNYSSNLFDSLESKSNTIIVSISIILAVVLNSYFLGRLEGVNIIANSFFYFGVAIVISSLALMLNLRRRLFKIIKIKSLRDEFIRDSNQDFRKIIIGKYIPKIRENLKNYHSKELELRIALNVMKLGSFILLISMAYIIIS